MAQPDGAVPAGRPGRRRPQVVVVGLGPAGADLLPPASVDAIVASRSCFLRTTRHPAAEAAIALRHRAGRTVETFDPVYDRAATFDEVYRDIVDRLAEAAGQASAMGETGGGPEAAPVCYAVPGSPLVAERTVSLLRRRPDLDVTVVPALSFLDLAWDRIGVDPVDAGVRIIDAVTFAADAAGQPGPFLVAQCHDRSIMSEVKLALGDWADQAGLTPPEAVLLHHLGLPEEQVLRVAWEEVDRALVPDHLTALWIPRWAATVAAESVRMEELVRVLRQRCPWDRRQTHTSVAPHLLEETYEVLDAIDALAGTGTGVGADQADRVDHLMEELGDVVFQVYFHAQLAAESGLFTMADVLRGVHDKLVHRHPHVFGEVVAGSAEDVATRWELAKQAEKGRASIFDGIPAALPALALTAKVQRKAEAVGAWPSPGGAGAADRVTAAAAAIAGSGGETDPDDPSRVGAGRLVGELLFSAVDLARQYHVDAETALRSVTEQFRQRVEGDR